MTHTTSQFALDPIRKPPMTERGDIINSGFALNKSSSNGNLINGNGAMKF
jgi:hypothetical protein